MRRPWRSTAPISDGERVGQRAARTPRGPLDELQLELQRGDGRAQLVRGYGEELVALAHLLLRLAVELGPLLDLLPLGDVAHSRDRVDLPTHVQGGEADLGGELRAVLSQPGEIQAEAHRARARRRMIARSVDSDA